MNPSHRSGLSSARWIRRCLTALLLTSFLLSACQPATPAPITTQPIQPTATAPAATKPVEPTIQPSPTSTATPTATLIPTQVPTFTPSSTPTIPPTPAAPQPFLLSDWNLSNFIEIPTGCRFPDLACLQTVTVREKVKNIEPNWEANSHVGVLAQNSQSTLASNTSLFINPSWKNPQLVYWYDNQIHADIYVTVKVDKGLQATIWENLAKHTFDGQNKGNIQWKMNAIDLSRYKGQKIFVRFNVEIILPPATAGRFLEDPSKWHLQEILIVPDFQPGKENELSAAVLSGQVFETNSTIANTQNPNGESSSQTILISDWKTINLSAVSGTCKFPDQVCWQSIINSSDDRQGSHQSVNTNEIKSESSLLSKTGINIDPAWNNPHLVIWYDNPTKGDLIVSLQVSAKWMSVAHYPLTAQGLGAWTSAVIDLSKFKGNNILISISAELITPKGNRRGYSGTTTFQWHIQNIQIIPNFQAAP